MCRVVVIQQDQLPLDGLRTTAESAEHYVACQLDDAKRAFEAQRGSQSHDGPMRFVTRSIGRLFYEYSAQGRKV